MTDQNYEEFYWKLTLAHSDFTGALFNEYLSKIVKFIDENRYEIEINLPGAYEQLQSILIADYGIDDVSIRKAINQFVKLGFIYSGLSGYHEDTKPFINETDSTKKMTLFSRVVYSNSSFDRSVNKTSDAKEINFFIKTLTENEGCLTRKEALALMTINVSGVESDYADSEMIQDAVDHVTQTDFETRKYNQMRYLWGLLGKLDDLEVADGKIYFSNDPRLELVQTDQNLPSKARDSYMQRLYKNLLIEESKRVYSAVVCMIEKLDYPGLIASHIKPYIKSNEQEAFDGNNGLLLSRSIDFLFDQGYISFDNDGKILVSLSRKLSEEIKSKISTYSLDLAILNESRRSYLDYHRTNVFIP